ncbi:cell division protein FtsN [Pseudomonas duriflava]|uniref:Cell division protein FtsN n=1 Tax=Pseudomonas duriflava TaxID=459528 RepID=A0A562QDQ6_9PSED|nr:SPOR domain-containing protein [Pseudomonas duriflava]TWI54166.1 cell division protein FtsN [Pseudomonas duriflava]
MAAKKAAPKRGASRNQPAAKRQPIPGWVWLASGLAIGGFVVFLMKLEPGSDAVRRAKVEEAAQAKSKPKTEAPTPTPVKPKYDFYTLLPESEVIVPPDAVPQTPTASTPPAPNPNPTTPVAPPTQPAAPVSSAVPAQPVKPGAAPPVTLFFLQAGSFRTQADADRVRAQIILFGQDVRVESGRVKDETWYRVLVGPYSDRNKLTQAQKQLASNGFKSLLLQQRQAR